MAHIRVLEGMLAPHDREAFLGQIAIDVDTGLIADVVEGTHKYTPDTVYDKDCLIFAGMGDIHIHARESPTRSQNHKEDYETAGDAALNGGTVHVATMPNTDPALVSQEDLEWHRRRIAEIGHPVEIFNYVGIDKESSPIGELGEHMYKCFFGKSVGDLTIYDEHELEEVLERFRGHHVSFHVEYEPIVEASVDGRTHSERRPIACVNHGLKLLLPLIEKYDIKAKLCHWSTGGQSFEIIEEHRARQREQGFPETTVEVSPLHLLFDTSMTDLDPSLWLKIQMNPAIQNPEHRRQLLEGLKSGFIDFLATDHAPHTEEEKYAAFAQYSDQHPNLTPLEIGKLMRQEQPELFNETCCQNGTSGAPWLDTYGSICTLLMQEEGFTSQDIARVAAFNPGRFVNQYLAHQSPDRNYGEGFGVLEKGYVGSLTVLNTNSPQNVRREDLKTKVGWSPLEGKVMPGRVEDVVIRGRSLNSRAA